MGRRPFWKRAPSVASNSSFIARSRSAGVSIMRTFQPTSLNVPPMPSQVCAAVSLTVTSIVPVVTSVSVPVFQ